jgi:hypothetical protein
MWNCRIEPLKEGIGLRRGWRSRHKPGTTAKFPGSKVMDSGGTESVRLCQARRLGSWSIGLPENARRSVRKPHGLVLIVTAAPAYDHSRHECLSQKFA